VAAAVIVADAPFSWTGELAAIAAEAELLLAADGGANRLARLGLLPARVIGDLDSIRPATRRWVGEHRLVSRPDQDRTDLDKTLEHALDELGLERLVVLGAVGGRTDHALGNLGLLAQRARGDRLVLRTADELILAVRGEACLPAVRGETWSFCTFDPAVRVTLAGVRWPLEGAGLDLPGRPSISNLAEGNRVQVNAQGGAVLVIRQLRPPGGQDTTARRAPGR
jgi:thiamine pyrophosphokinase